MAPIKDIPAGYSPVLPDEVFFEGRAERAYMEAATEFMNRPSASARKTR